MKPPVLCLAGPTAAGKTELAVELAQRHPIEIISVDSAAVYRDMDIGTSKPDAVTLAKAPHRLIDFLDPAEAYSAARFCDDARRHIAEIHAAGRIPLLAGGTMLYFRALLNGLSELPEADAAVREEITKEAETHGWQALHEQLAEVDPDAAARIHPNDPQRLQRALEVYRITGRSLTSLQRETGRRLDEDYMVGKIALMPADRALLHQRIATRFSQMLAEGLVEEVRALFQREDLNSSLPSIRSVGYRQVWQYLTGELDRETMVEKAVVATRQLAKRQLTWLRSDQFDLTLDPLSGSPIEQMLRTIENKLKLQLEYAIFP